MFNFNIYFAPSSIPPSFIDSSSSIPCSIVPGSRFNLQGGGSFGSLNPEILEQSFKNHFCTSFIFALLQNEVKASKGKSLEVLDMLFMLIHAYQCSA